MNICSMYAYHIEFMLKESISPTFSFLQQPNLQIQIAKIKLINDNKVIKTNPNPKRVI